MRNGIAVRLSPTDRKRLQAIVDDRNSPQTHVWRARIVLATADGLGTVEIMRAASVSKTAVWRWKARFTEAGVEGLLRDKIRPSRVPKLANEVAERIAALTLGGRAGETTHWISRVMAKVAGISLTSVHRIWRARGLAPHRIRTFKLSCDPESAAKVRDIVGLYVDPPAHAVILSVDEKLQIQALDPRRQAPRHDHPARRLRRAGAPPRWTLHFTPTSASWRNAVEEGFFAILTKRRLKPSVFKGVAKSEA